MSAFENIVGGKLRLKGKPLDVKSGGIVKKKKKQKHLHLYDHSEEVRLSSVFSFWRLIEGSARFSSDQFVGDNENEKDGSRSYGYDDHLTAAERRFIQQTQKLELQRLAKMARKSHRDSVQEFNQYLANLSEHYDIPKVGPG